MPLSIEPAQRWKKVLWDFSAVRFLTYLVLGVWVLAGDPFRLSSSSDNALSEAYHNFQVRLDGVSPPPLTVVTIDNEDIRLAHAEDFFASDDWPLDYVDHSALLPWLLGPEDQPATAIFYDIFFEKPRSSSGDLGTLGTRLSEIADYPDLPVIYLAGGGDYMPISPASRQALDGASLSPSAWSEQGDYYPLAAPLKDGEEPISTPAARMYQLLCQASSDACPYLAPTSPPISVRWGLRNGPACVPERIFERSGLIVERVYTAVLQGLFDIKPPPPPDRICFPIRTLKLRHLRANGPEALVPPDVAPGEPYGVMLGVSIPSAGDFHPTPVFEPLPGVHFHAMAFENLWHQRDNYLRLHDFTKLSFGIWGMAVVGFMWQARRRHENENHTGLKTAMLWWFAIAGAVVLLQLVFHHLLHIVPEGWMSLAAILPLLREVVLRNEAAYQHKTHKQ
ncbi:CHASE2 domain-containing protein [Halomonas daqiaonensis]|uniref:CHASE2 domain-containing protein n=1 Tax=Halomonas daqiaonensis TaxID=650850 RepID=A0A1H7RZ78_9GAMM|nr:CHASE2 domain-containing protein [Halomonas daqiaonensis]SEL65416.1 CHASE2 domain-containing protein [Halomonas daqiaonensis]